MPDSEKYPEPEKSALPTNAVDREKMLAMFNMLERLFNEHARKMCESHPKWGVKPDWFYIHILPEAIHETEIKSGTTVHIYTRILPTNPEANSYIRGWMKVVAKVHVNSSLMLREDVYRWKQENHKAIKVKELEAEIINSDRLVIKTEVTVTVKDRYNGNVVVKTGPENKLGSLIEQARVELTRMIDNSDILPEV